MSPDPSLLDPSHPEWDPFGEDKPRTGKPRSHGFRRKQGGVEDLFGAASGLDPEKTGVVPGASKKRKPPDHHERSQKWLAERGYYLSAKTEWWCARPDGYQWKRDLFGFADRLAWKEGVTYAIQIKDGWHNLNDALRDMCSNNEIKGQPYPTKRQNLEACLKAGIRVLVLLWEKHGAFYEAKLEEVTLTTVAEVDSRRRRVA